MFKNNKKSGGSKMGEELFLDELYNEFIKEQIVQKDITRYTQNSYRSDFKIFLSFLMKQGIKATPQNMNKKLLRDYTHYLKFNKEYATATMRRKIHSLSSFFKYMYEERYIEYNCMASIKAPKKPRNIPIYIKSEDVKKILNATDEIGGNFILRDKCFFLLAFLTGARRTELINLRWKDINFGNMTVLIKKGKGRKSRVVPLLPPLPTYLKALQTENKKDINDYILYNTVYNQIHETEADALFRKYIKHCKLQNKGYTLHKCRHTYATNLAKTLGIEEIAELLGHEDINTSRIYTHITTEDIQNKIKDANYIKQITKDLL